MKQSGERPPECGLRQADCVDARFTEVARCGLGFILGQFEAVRSLRVYVSLRVAPLMSSPADSCLQFTSPGVGAALVKISVLRCEISKNCDDMPLALYLVHVEVVSGPTGRNSPASPHQRWKL